MRTQGLVLSHLSQLGLRVNWEKSKLLPTQRISFLSMEFGFGQTDSAPHTGTRSVSAELLEYVQEQDGGTTETVSEAPGAYGGCSGGHTAGAAPYESIQHWLHGRVPRWAWQSGMLWVQVTPACRQTFTPWSDLSFLRAGVPLEQVSRHAVVYTDASAKGWGATFNGLAVSGVWTGPQLHWHINCLELLAVHLALNRLETLTRQARTGPYGQHCDRCVHQPTRWSMLPSHVATRPPPPPLELEASEVASPPFIFRACSTGQPTSCHELRSPESGDSIPSRSS